MTPTCFFCGNTPKPGETYVGLYQAFVSRGGQTMLPSGDAGTIAHFPKCPEETAGG